MPLSLRLPYAVCYPLACWARRKAKPRSMLSLNQESYFDHQYRSSDSMCRRYMKMFPLEGKVVLDLGSGLGGRAPYWLNHGAEHVFCIDINRQELAVGRHILIKRFPQLSNRITFIHPDDLTTHNIADAAIFFDVFEHLINPEAVLLQASQWLRTGGKVWIGSVGWYNYMASHCLGHIPIPWCQMLFSEHAIISTIRTILHTSGYVPNIWEALEGLDRWDAVTGLK